MPSSAVVGILAREAYLWAQMRRKKSKSNWCILYIKCLFLSDNKGLASKLQILKNIRPKIGSPGVKAAVRGCVLKLIKCMCEYIFLYMHIHLYISAPVWTAYKYMRRRLYFFTLTSRLFLWPASRRQRNDCVGRSPAQSKR